MADEGEVSALVCDNGSGMVKVRRERRVTRVPLHTSRAVCQGGKLVLEQRVIRGRTRVRAWGQRSGRTRRRGLIAAVLTHTYAF